MFSFLLRRYYSYLKETTMPVPTDQQVVAAINSCIDFAKLSKIPTGVIDRFRQLVVHNRVRPVCFFLTDGFGLRIYKDAEDYDMVFEGDMTRVEQPNTFGRLDLDGCWMKCPPSAWKEDTGVQWIVASDNGRRFFDGDREDFWSSIRSSAKKFDKKEDAQAEADRIGGVVLKAG
jgi:hypothetical protein